MDFFTYWRKIKNICYMTIQEDISVRTEKQ